ncbi:hypothetical protein [Paenibacillus sedimenti]|uniref:Heparinase n=1 Tax=Paenibacillus sedimenti TaxID=2770274 RepID=A0A926KQK9_9BACL|nr:hypothetical protein [Paenibacillus sedimenti]MBD0381498.1 hypothetical protein [Paenibacillus sedimenti]
MTAKKWHPYFLATLNSWHKGYNPELRMVRRPFKSPGYHTTIKQADFVHPTREALLYAVALLDSELPEYRDRAFAIIEQVVSLQDADPASPTFGIWSWFYEEPLAQMSPPDWNWADFCGKQLLLAIVRHGDLFPPALLERTKMAVRNSCDAIIERNVGPGYTNIAIMGAFVTLIAGESFGDERYRTYGFDRLERLCQYTREQGTFTEYNSPTYTIVAIEELSSIATETRIPEARAMAEELLELAWGMMAYHFHPLLLQWSGPHSRAYETLLPPEKLSFLQYASDGKVQLVPEGGFTFGITWYGNDIKCPEKYVSLFQDIGERELHQIVSRQKDGSKEKRASMYMNAGLAFGTFSSGIMWNQRRNLLAYVANGAHCTYVHFRALHDGYDYSSAVFTGLQHRGNALFGVNFATDGGGTHPNLDKVHGRITASDLRLRFEIGGCQDHIDLVEHEDRVRVRIAGISVAIDKLYCLMDGETDFRWEISRDGRQTCVDLVIHSGEPAAFDFHQIPNACFLFAFSVADTDQAMLKEVRQHPDGVEGTAQFGESDALTLRIPAKPDVLDALLN